MFARSTTITGDPAAVDAAIDFVRDEVMPAVTQMDGCLGLSLVVRRDSGRCIATSSWESQDAMTASDDLLAGQRATASRLLRGRAAVEEWEVALMHRDRASAQGACCRISWARTHDVDQLVEKYRTVLLPRIEDAEGFCSASVFVDRAGGRACGTVTFDSRAALDATRERAAVDRVRTRELVDIWFTDVAEFELVLAHLRVPQLV